MPTRTKVKVGFLVFGPSVVKSAMECTFFFLCGLLLIIALAKRFDVPAVNTQHESLIPIIVDNNTGAVYAIADSSSASAQEDSGGRVVADLVIKMRAETRSLPYVSVPMVVKKTYTYEIFSYAENRIVKDLHSKHGNDMNNIFASGISRPALEFSRRRPDPYNVVTKGLSYSFVAFMFSVIFFLIAYVLCILDLYAAVCRAVRKRKGRCEVCGYALAAGLLSCPECGSSSVH